MHLQPTTETPLSAFEFQGMLLLQRFNSISICLKAGNCSSLSMSRILEAMSLKIIFTYPHVIQQLSLDNSEKTHNCQVTVNHGLEQFGCGLHNEETKITEPDGTNQHMT